MANRYANLVGANKIKDEFTKINDGFQAVQDDMDQKSGNAFAQINTVAAGEPSDSLTIEAGTGITIVDVPGEKKLRVVATGEATPGEHGIEHNHDGSDPIPELVEVREDLAALQADLPQEIEIRDNRLHVSRQLENTDKASYYCKYYNNANQAMPGDGVYRVLSFNTKLYDTNSFHPDSSTFYAYKDGVYLINAGCEFDTAVGGTRAIKIIMNDTKNLAIYEVPVPTARIVDVSVSAVQYMQKGEFIKVMVSQSSGVALNVFGGSATNLHACYVSLTMLSQPITEVSSIEYRGIAKVFKDKFKNPAPIGHGSVIELTTLVDGNRVDAWTDNGSGGMVYTYSDSRDANVWSTPVTALASCRFPFTFKYNGKYYTIGGTTSNYELFQIYLWESTDKINWTMLNGGNPIITKNASGVWKYIWNTTVVVVGDTWHVWVESGSQSSQSDVGLAYTYGTLSNLASFNANKSAGHVIEGGGNPSAVYIPERNAALILHGEIFEDSDTSGEKNFWTIRASYVYFDDDLSLQASYTRTTKSQFYIYQSGKHICDPQIVELPGDKTSRLLLFYSYDQLTQYQTFADVSMLELFDALTE